MGLTQQEFAARLMISRNYVSQLETGRKEVSRKLLRRINTILAESTSSHHLGNISEPAASYAENIAAQARADFNAKRSIDAMTQIAEARRLFEEVVSASRNIPALTGWILEQVRQHLRVPSHWPHIPSNPEDHPAVKEAKADALAKQAFFLGEDSPARKRKHSDGNQAAS